MTVVDAHAHVWRAVADYPDPALTIVSPVTDVPVSLLGDYMDDHAVDRAVLVQPICAGTDNGYVADAASADPRRFAAVCVVDPVSPAVDEELERWAARGCRGVRVRATRPDEAAAFGSGALRAFWEAARRLELVVSVYTGFDVLPAIGAAARDLPEVPIVLDHFALPDLAQREWQDLLDLADAPGIRVKVSGYHHFSGERDPYEDAWKLFRSVHEAFGADRLLWGSDFPHVLLRGGYGRSRSLQERAFDFLDEGELAAVMGGTAASLYWPADAA